MPHRKEMREMLSQAYMDPERIRAIGKAIAAELAQLEMPSYMEMVVQHQKENPHKSPTRCMVEMIKPYEKARDEAIRKSIEK